MSGGRGNTFMVMDFNEMINQALELKATRAGIVATDAVKFSQELRQMCAQNYCGNYGKNWMCPPGVGPFKELQQKVMEFKQGLVIQTVHELEDSFDIEGMEQAQSKHNNIFKGILSMIKNEYNPHRILPLNVGACDICSKCAYAEDKECYFPEKAIASVESYGINVMALVSQCDFPYNNGSNTVSYVGYILFDQ